MSSGNHTTPVERMSRLDMPADTVLLARSLLGKVLVREMNGVMMAGRIVETEAYLQHDPACHAYRGITPRNRSLFLEHGHAYVYLCYGTSYLLNVSTEGSGIGSGVLLRALEPMYGADHMQRNVLKVKSKDLTRGPGRLTAAMRIDKRYDGIDLFAHEQLWIGSDDNGIARADALSEAVGESVRIGLTKGADARLRYFVRGSRYLSGSRKLNQGL